MQRTMTTKQPQPAVAGVIETIADGLSAILVRPGLMIVPILLDLYLWLGWKLSLRALTDSIASRIAAIDARDTEDLVDRLHDLGRSDANWLLAIQTPSLLSDANRSDIYAIRDRAIATPGDWWVALALLVAIVAGGTLIPMLYAVPIADTATGRERSPRQTAIAILRACARFLGLALTMIAIALVATSPFIALGVVAALGGSSGGAVVGAGASLVIAAMFILLFFAPDAIVVSDVGPIRAIRLSVRLVRAAFWQTLAFVAASTLITLGLSEIWLRMADNAPGLAIGVLLNAFIATGLALASMLFYVARIRLLQPDAVPDVPLSPRL